MDRRTFLKKLPLVLLPFLHDDTLLSSPQFLVQGVGYNYQMLGRAGLLDLGTAHFQVLPSGSYYDLLFDVSFNTPWSKAVCKMIHYETRAFFERPFFLPLSSHVQFLQPGRLLRKEESARIIEFHYLEKEIVYTVQHQQDLTRSCLPFREGTLDPLTLFASLLCSSYEELSRHPFLFVYYKNHGTVELSFGTHSAQLVLPEDLLFSPQASFSLSYSTDEKTLRPTCSSFRVDVLHPAFTALLGDLEFRLQQRFT